MIIFHQRNRFNGTSVKKMKELVAKRDNKISFEDLQLDHIIPYCVSANNSLDNLQLLTKEKHKEKTIRDHKKIKLLREKGFIEKITNNQHEIKLKPSKMEKIWQFLEQVERMERQSLFNLHV